MIRRYNTKQIIKALFLILGSIICFALSYFFFRYLPAYVVGRLGYDVPESIAVTIGVAGVIATCFSGYRQWSDRGGLYSYHESALYHDVGGETAGGTMTDIYLHRVTGPAYMISQIFLAGPLWLLRALTLVSSRIPYSAERESKMAATLKTINAANKWQGLNDYPEAHTEVLHLAQMDLVDFSGHKGIPRFKAK